MSKWMPIESAPLHKAVIGWDGREVWLFVRWKDAPAWQSVGDARRYADPQPTHWMPLPEPPHG